MKSNGDIVEFLRKKDYIMLNNELGGGFFGKTVLLKDPFIDELFVAKKYEPDTDDIAVKEKYYKNFLDEIKILYKLNHENIVRIFNYYPYENSLTGYILMEFIDGVKIDKYILSEYDGTSLVSINDMFKQLIEGFNYIETNGIIHRDIREGNIMIDKKGKVKIIDFGIGKITERGGNGTDSLVADINRNGSDTLPQEYFEGIYTSKTDMFYLAELLKRLMDSSPFIENSSFLYHNIINKMMSKNPDKRYASFAKIKEAIDKQDFNNMNISDSDKQIYLELANYLDMILIRFFDERKFNRDIDIFVERLEQVLHNNLFEDNIQNNSDILRSLITGNYLNNDYERISRNSLEKFVQWYKNTTQQFQQLILNNLITKLSYKDVVESEPDLPF